MTFREPLRLHSARRPAVPAGGGIVGGCAPRLRLCACLGALPRCARCRSGGRSFCRALKSPAGAFSLAPLCQPPPLRRGSLAARPLRGCGVAPPPAPPSRSISALIRLSARAAQALVPRALACRSLARFSAPFGSVGRGRSALRLALAAPFPSLCAAPSVAPRGSPRRQPFLPLPLLGGGLSRSPLRGLPLGWVRSAPPAVLFRRAVGGAVSSFPVGVRCAFPLSALRRRGHHPPPASKAGAVLYHNPSRVNRQSSAYRQLSSRGRGSRGFHLKPAAAVQGFCFPLMRAALALPPLGHSPLFCLLVCMVLFRRS